MRKDAILDRTTARAAAVALAIALALLTLSAAPVRAVGDAAIVTFETNDGTFAALFTDPDDIALAEAALAADGIAGIPVGQVVLGDGGVNIGHNWHIEDAFFAEVTIELCDATAAHIDENLESWIAEVGQFCPWTAIVVDVEPLGEDVTELPETGSGPALDGFGVTAWMHFGAAGVALAIAIGGAIRWRHQGAARAPG